MVSDSRHSVIPAATMLPTKPDGVLHPAVARVLENNPTPETLREILAMQREWEAAEAKRAFTRALVALKRDLPMWIQKDKVVDFAGTGSRVHYTHASLAGAMEAVLPHLTEHGFSLSWKPATKGGAVFVTAILTHRDGHSEEATLDAPPDTKGSKSGAQAVASTVTLLQRYTALALLGLATADMAEPGNGTAAPSPEAHVDSARNMRALRDITASGRTKEEAELFVGRVIQQWTVADLGRLRKWITPPPAPAAAAPVEPEGPMEEPVEESEPGADVDEPPSPPANPKDGDRWEEVVQVLESRAENHPTNGPYIVLKVRHAGGKETKHASFWKPVAELAKQVSGKDEIVRVTFAAKLNKEKKLFINIDAMALAPHDIPF